MFVYTSDVSDLLPSDIAPLSFGIGTVFGPSFESVHVLNSVLELIRLFMMNHMAQSQQMQNVLFFRMNNKFLQVGRNSLYLS